MVTRIDILTKVSNQLDTGRSKSPMQAAAMADEPPFMAPSLRTTAGRFEPVGRGCLIGQNRTPRSAREMLGLLLQAADRYGPVTGGYGQKRPVR